MAATDFEQTKEKTSLNSEGEKGCITHFVVNRKTNAFRIEIGKSDDIGVFAKLCNTYLIVGDDIDSQRFSDFVKGDQPEIPVISTTLSGCRVIGRMCVGNKRGLVVPENTYDTELNHIREVVPEGVEVRKVDDRLSALGNVVVCNDHVALIHPELDKESEEIIKDCLGVEIFRYMIANNPLVGSYSVLTNKGGLVHASLNGSALESLSSLLQLPLIAGTVNRGNFNIASGVVVNDKTAYAGLKTTAQEFTAIENAFCL